MKNEVNRAPNEGAKKKQFLSKSVPRGTRTIWRYLGALFILFTFAIGQMWAADPTLSFGTTSATTSTYLGTYESEGITISSDRSYSSGMVQLGSTPSNYNSYYVQVSAGVAIDSIHVLMSGNGSNKNLHAPMFGWATSATSNDADTYSYPAEQTTNGNGYTYAKWFKYDMTGASVKCTRIYRSVKNVSSANPSYTGSSTALGSGQTIQIYGMKIWLHKHTVTLNPNGGSYASTPEGWTLSAGKYTKAVFAGSLALPEPAYSGNTFAGWKNKNNEDVASPITVSRDTVLTAQWTPSGATTHDITYTNLKGSDVSAYPTKYYEGTGIASFDALADVTDFHFNGWSPASIAADATTDQTISATWVAAYNVAFSAGAGSGTVPTSFQKWEGATFELPGQGSMVAPSGKLFDGWKASGTKYAAGAEYTMTAAAVEFVAQWKAAPTVLFHYNMGNIDAAPADGTENSATGGKILFKNAKMGKESSSFNAAVKGDMIGGANSLKLGGNADSIRINLTTGNFQEGDTIYITGYNPFVISTTTARDGDVVESLTTGTAKTDYNIGYCVIPAGIDSKYLYIGRTSSSCGFAAIKVIRPAARPVFSTEITLSDVKVNGTSISAANLATLVANHSLTLGDEFVTAPEIKFNEHKVITYDDELLPATKVTDKVYTVTATVNGEGQWQAQQEVDGNTYTVKAPKQSSVKLAYYDGATKLGEETVGIGGHPAEYAAKQSKDFATFVAWYSNSDLAEEHKIANIAELVVNYGG